MGFSPDKDIIKSTKNSFEVDFKVLSPQDIQASQNEQIDEVSLILDLPPEFSAILLRYTRWNKEKLVASYIDNPESLLESAGLGPESTGSRKIMVLDGFMCDICCDDEEGLETYAMICGHRYCVDCYRHYLGQKIKEEGEAARIECPSEVCHRIVDSKSLDLLVTEDLADRFVYQTGCIDSSANCDLDIIFY
jgi:ariadne-1